MCRTCAQCVGSLIARLLKFALACGAFIFFVAAIAPNVPVLLGEPLPPSSSTNSTDSFVGYNYYATSVFYAGMASSNISRSLSSAEKITSFVSWQQLDSRTVCTNGTSIFELWALPLGICVPCDNSPNLNGLCYQTPSQVIAQQAVLIIAVILSGILVIWQFIGLFCQFNYKICAIIDGLFSMTLFAFGTATFPLWKTQSIAGTLQISGRIPVFTLTGVPTIVASDPVTMTTSYAFNCMVVGFAFSLCCLLTAYLEDFSGICCCGGGKKQEKAEKKEEKQAEDKSGASYCCCIRMDDKKDSSAADGKEAKQPNAAEAGTAGAAEAAPDIENPAALGTSGKELVQQ